MPIGRARHPDTHAVLHRLAKCMRAISKRCMHIHTYIVDMHAHTQHHVCDLTCLYTVLLAHHICAHSLQSYLRGCLG